MAFGTGVGLVAIIADRMNLFLGLVGGGSTLDVVAVTTPFLAVTIDTPKPEQVDMLFMLERHHRAILVRRIIYFLRRRGDYRMGTTKNIGGVISSFGEFLSRQRQMADHTLCIVAPLAVTG